MAGALLFVVGLPGIILGLLMFFTVREPRGQALKPMPKNIFAEVWDVQNHDGDTEPAPYCYRHHFGGVCRLWCALLERRLFPSGFGPVSGETGTLLALIGGIIGGIGTLSGGWLADRLAQRDKRMYVWLTAGVKLAILPIAIWYYLTTDLLTAIILTSITSFLAGFIFRQFCAQSKSVAAGTARPRFGSFTVLHQYCRARFRTTIGRHFIGLFLCRLWSRRLALCANCRGLPESVGLLPLFLGGSKSERGFEDR